MINGVNLLYLFKNCHNRSIEMSRKNDLSHPILRFTFYPLDGIDFQFVCTFSIVYKQPR